MWISSVTLCEALSGPILPSNRGLQAVWCTCASWCFVAWKGVVMLCLLCRLLCRHVSTWPSIQSHLKTWWWTESLAVSSLTLFESCAGIKPACCVWMWKIIMNPQIPAGSCPCPVAHLGNCQHKRSHIWSNIRTHLQGKLKNPTAFRTHFMDFTRKRRVPESLISTEIGIWINTMRVVASCVPRSEQTAVGKASTI